jgi:uncharacterized protein
MNQEIKEYIDSLPVYSDHEHHMPDEWFACGMDLDKAINQAYVHWTGFTSDGTYDSRARLLDNVRFNSYYYWFEKGLQQIHGIDKTLTADNWPEISRHVSDSYADSNFHCNSLKQAGYRKIIQDAHWNPGDDMGHPGLFAVAHRVDKFMHGIDKESETLDDFNVWEHYGFEGETLSEYITCMDNSIKGNRGQIAALKCADAYLRSLDFSYYDEKLAGSAFGKSPLELSKQEELAFSNYIFHHSCKLAQELNLPFQIHAGLGDLSGSNPMLLEPIIKQYPDVKFVLFHSGYPWTSQVGALAHNYTNVCPSLTWTATVSTSVAIRVLDEYIDIAPSVNTITWGGDCHVPEDSVGALLAWRYIVATVMSGRLQNAAISMNDAKLLAGKLLYENVRNLYELK